MLFNSYEFIFTFLPLTFFIYFFLLQKRLISGAKGFLVFASLLFYSWWNTDYLPLILASMLFNYVVGNSLNENFKKVQVHKKTLLGFGIVANLTLLAYFKYTDFFLENFNQAFNSSIPLLHLALPLAISFFTFQQIAYLVDSYRQETAKYNFLNYALFVTFFPQLIAGPIVHHAEMMPQFSSKWNLVKRYKNIAFGLFIFSMGLFKKVVIADTFAQWASHGFDKMEVLNFVEAWVTSLSYTFQLYFDFSGYTDMAIGAALLFNIKLPINFNSPYKALDIQDFWRRWHITLSRFLKDYIYIPLGGNRKSTFHTYTNLIATFVLGGIWHGAGWTFVFWGFLHGLALVIHRFWKNLGFTMPKNLAWFITFNFVNIAWIFFRAKEWEDAIKILNGMFGIEKLLAISSLNSKNIHFEFETYLWINITLLISTLLPNTYQITKYPKFNHSSLIGIPSTMLFSLIFLIALFWMSISTYSEFIYFNF